MNTFKRLVAAIALLIGFAVLGPTPVHASTCQAVLYDGPNYTGDYAWLDGPGGGGYSNLNTTSFDNRTDSVRNYACGLDLYSGLNGSGTHIYLAPGASIGDLFWWSMGRNTISSVHSRL